VSHQCPTDCCFLHCHPIIVKTIKPSINCAHSLSDGTAWAVGDGATLTVIVSAPQVYVTPPEVSPRSSLPSNPHKLPAIYCILRYDLAIVATRPLPTIRNDSVGALTTRILFIERRAIRKNVVVFGSLLLSANFPK
jgi:hypothetical protein